jgi:hypothetical protein
MTSILYHKQPTIDGKASKGTTGGVKLVRLLETEWKSTLELELTEVMDS